MLCVVAPPGFHKYVTPAEALAVNTDVGCEHVIVPLCDTCTVGTVVSTGADPQAVAMQPVAESVTVTQYVAPEVTTIVCVVAPPGLHRYVTFPEATAVNVAVESRQVIV